MTMICHNVFMEDTSMTVQPSTMHTVQELAEEFGRHRAREFNMGVERRDTGVRFEDVAGIDDVKADIEEVMKMILGDAEYRAMGARPPRVCTIRTLLESLCQTAVDGAHGALLCVAASQLLCMLNAFASWSDLAHWLAPLL